MRMKPHVVPHKFIYQIDSAAESLPILKRGRKQVVESEEDDDDADLNTSSPSAAASRLFESALINVFARIIVVFNCSCNEAFKNRDFLRALSDF